MNLHSSLEPLNIPRHGYKGSSRVFPFSLFSDYYSLNFFWWPTQTASNYSYTYPHILQKNRLHVCTVHPPCYLPPFYLNGCSVHLHYPVKGIQIYIAKNLQSHLQAQYHLTKQIHCSGPVLPKLHLPIILNHYIIRHIETALRFIPITNHLHAFST